MENTFEATAKVFKAFSDESRLMILHLLKDGELCAMDLLAELPINQSTLSHHMKILCESGVVECYKNGKWTHYYISAQGSQYAKELVETLTSPNIIVLHVNSDEPLAAGVPGADRWL